MKKYKYNIDLSKEKNYLDQYDRIVGIDEVGRGCLAGEVLVCGYILTKTTQIVDGVYDSKRLSEKTKNEIFAKTNKDEFIIKTKSSYDIDRLGIAKAIEQCIEEIVTELNDEKTFFIIDGKFSKSFGANSIKIEKADQNYYSVALASIIAKVTRDKSMNVLANLYPQYSFDENKGYGTAKHIDAIKRFGYSKIHRQSFKLKK